MPDNTEKTMWDLVIAAAGIFGLKEIAAQAARKAVEPFVMPLTQDFRGEITADLLRMPEADKANLERRIQDASRNHTENKVIFLLGKLPEEGDQGRRPSLKRMNDLDEANFFIYLSMLEHDVFVQWLRGFADRNHDGKVSREDLAAVGAIVAEALSPITGGLKKAGGVIKSGVRDLDDAAGRATPGLRRLTEAIRRLNEEKDDDSDEPSFGNLLRKMKR
jgi:hypothetical protein